MYKKLTLFLTLKTTQLPISWHAPCNSSESESEANIGIIIGLVIIAIGWNTLYGALKAHESLKRAKDLRETVDKLFEEGELK